MALADTSRAQLRYIAESVYGEVPGSGNPNNLRFTGESLDFSISGATSNEIRDDRQKNGYAQLSADAQGGVNIEPSYLEYDTLLEALLQGTWAAYGTNGVGSTFTADFASNTITASVAPTGANAFTTLAKGQWFRLTAPSNANDGLFCRVSSSVAPTSTVITLDAATPLTVGTSVANCLIATSRLVNGTTLRSFSLEKSFSDVGQFFVFRGMVPGTFSISMESGAFVTGAFGFTGKDAEQGTATFLPGSPVASKAYNILSAVAGVGHLMEGGALLSGTFINKLEMQIDNKLRGRKAIGNLGSVSVGTGTLEVSGSMEVYLSDGSLYNKMVNNTASSLSVRISDEAGNGYIIQLPRINYKDAKVNAGAKDQDAMLVLPFEATLDPTSGATGKTVLIDRVGVAAA
jgi:hypothetical protein